MKLKSLIFVFLGLILASSRLSAQGLFGDSEKKARELLRETVNKREVPTPAPIFTNNSAPLPGAAQGANLTPTGLKSSRSLNYAEVEQAYLSGKISARQFQKFLENGQQEPAPVIYSHTQPITPRQEKPPLAAPIILKGPQPAPIVSTQPATTAKTEAKPEEPSASPSPLNEVEKKMDELLRLKAAREQAAAVAATALTTTNGQESAAPKSKRERLDALLKLYINGKISESEYKERRDKMVVE